MLTTSGSLFTGSGALDLAVTEVFGATPIWFAENDPAAVKVLTHHWPNVPNLGDITTVEWQPHHRADVLTGGFPCNDVSVAGRKAGLKPSTRSGLWSHMAYAIGVLQPELVVIENVRGLTSATAHCDLEPCPWCVGDPAGSPLRALGAVLGDLADLRYDARWCGLRASDVGAPHPRYRVFITARPAPYPGSEAGALRAGLRPNEPCGVRGGRPHHGAVAVAADPGGAGRGTREGTHPRTGPPAVRDGAPAPPHPAGPGGGQQRAGHVGDLSREALRAGQAEPRRCDSAIDWGIYEPAIRRWERILGRPVPDPTITGKRGGQQLSPAFVEWLMGWPHGWVTAVPNLSRNDQLRICGNGVVPQQAVAALRYLTTIYPKG